MKKGYLFFAGLLLASGIVSYFGFVHIIPWVYPKAKVETWKLFGWAIFGASTIVAIGVVSYGTYATRKKADSKRTFWHSPIEGGEWENDFYPDQHVH